MGITRLQRQLKGETPLDQGPGGMRILSVIDRRDISWDPVNV